MASIGKNAICWPRGRFLLLAHRLITLDFERDSPLFSRARTGMPADTRPRKSTAIKTSRMMSQPVKAQEENQNYY